MAKGTKGNRATAKKKTATKAKVAARPTSKTASQARLSAATLEKAVADERVHGLVFSTLVARSRQFNASPVCYRVFDDGSAQICRLMSDGSYGECETYYHRPVPGPQCG